VGWGGVDGMDGGVFSVSESVTPNNSCRNGHPPPPGQFPESGQRRVGVHLLLGQRDGDVFVVQRPESNLGRGEGSRWGLAFGGGRLWRFSFVSGVVRFGLWLWRFSIWFAGGELCTKPT